MNANIACSRNGSIAVILKVSQVRYQSDFDIYTLQQFGLFNLVL